MPRASWAGDARLGTNEDEFTGLCPCKRFILLPPSPNYTCIDLKLVISKHMVNFNETENTDTIILAEIQTRQLETNRDVISNLQSWQSLINGLFCLPLLTARHLHGVGFNSPT